MLLLTNVHKLKLNAVNVFTMFVLYTIKLVLKNIPKEADTAPYNNDVNELFMYVTRLVDTARYNKLVNEQLMKVTRLVETAP